MRKIYGVIIMGLIATLLAVLTGCAQKSDFNPAPDAVIKSFSMSRQGMARDDYYFYCISDENGSIFLSAEFYDHEIEDFSESQILLENIAVDASYMTEFRALAEKNGLVDYFKKYREPKRSPDLLDGESCSSYIEMSDGSKCSSRVYLTDYTVFFKALTEKYRS